MVLVSLHLPDVPVVPNTCAENVLFDVVPKSAGQDRLPVFCYKNQVNHQEVLIMPPMLILVHAASKNTLNITTKYVIIIVVKLL